MKSTFQIIGVIAIFLALLIPQSGHGQTKLKVGDIHEGGIVFSNDGFGQLGQICQTIDLGKMDYDEAIVAFEKLGDGWRCPTLQELALMYVNLHKKGQGGFEEGYYWGGDGKHGYKATIDFRSGELSKSFEGPDNNHVNNYVRAVKDFSPLNEEVDTLTPKKWLLEKTYSVGDEVDGGIVYRVKITVGNRIAAGHGFAKICQTIDLGKMGFDEAEAACKKLGDGWEMASDQNLSIIYDNLHKKGLGGFEEYSYWGQYKQNFNFQNGELNRLKDDKYVCAVKSLNFIVKESNYPIETEMADGSPKKYSVGEKAFGGIIFYVDDSGEHGLVCQTKDLKIAGKAGRCRWEDADEAIKKLGYGWFMPSTKQARAMHNNLHIKELGDFLVYHERSDHANGHWTSDFRKKQENWELQEGNFDFANAVLFTESLRPIMEDEEMYYWYPTWELQYARAVRFF